MNGALYLAIAIVGEVIATSFLRASAGFTQPVPTVIVIVGYGVTFYFFSLALQTIPVGIGYAIWSGVGIILVSIIAFFAYGQTLDLPALIGIGLILARLPMASWSSTSSASRARTRRGSSATTAARPQRAAPREYSRAGRHR
jgi:multidrug transporter EmrE-like cation transporter